MRQSEPTSKTNAHVIDTEADMLKFLRKEGLDFKLDERVVREIEREEKGEQALEPKVEKTKKIISLEKL